MTKSSNNRTVIILGSSRIDGDARKMAVDIVDRSSWDLIDLNDYQFSYYDYENLNRHDDYLPLIKEILDKYDTIIFATPVYWYAMSGIMKVFFDRFTDLLTIEKELGRKLRGKRMAAISCSVGENLGDDFWLPFSKTANYLGMEYLGHVHTISGSNDHTLLINFIKKVEIGY